MANEKYTHKKKFYEIVLKNDSIVEEVIKERVNTPQNKFEIIDIKFIDS